MELFLDAECNEFINFGPLGFVVLVSQCFFEHFKMVFDWGVCEVIGGIWIIESFIMSGSISDAVSIVELLLSDFLKDWFELVFLFAFIVFQQMEI